MGKILREAVEKRRNVLTEKLLALDVYKKEEEYVLKLSLTNLEKELEDYTLARYMKKSLRPNSCIPHQKGPFQ